MDTREKALVVFYNAKKEIVLQKREGISKHGEKWEFFGGGINKGELSREAAIREIREELSYDLQKVEYLGTFIGTAGNTMHVFVSPLDDISPLCQLE